MPTLPSRLGPRARQAPVVARSAVRAELVLLGIGLLLLAYLSLGTPAFTDYEAESEPAIQALIAGHLAAGLRLLPVYGGSVLPLVPVAGLAKLLGGGDLAVYRAVVIPGAAAVAWLAVVAARWLREAGADRRTQLIAVGTFACSPCVALAWNFGHPEEALVACAGVGGLILVAGDRTGGRATLAGGALLGLAAAGKLWAVVLLPVALAATSSGRAAARMTAAAGVAGALLFVPVAIHQASGVGAIQGTGQIFTSGNLWWFLGTPNPGYHPDSGSVSLYVTTTNWPRIAPAFVEAHARQFVVAIAVGLAGVWAWIDRRSAPLPAAERMASLLLLAAAVIWWRAVVDPWFQAYYLLAALPCIVLADARRGRMPVAGLIAWGALWLLHGQNAPDMGLSPDQQSALRLLWLVPMGGYLTARSLRRSA